MREILEAIAAILIVALQVINVILSNGLTKDIKQQNEMIRSRLSGSDQK